MSEIKLGSLFDGSGGFPLAGSLCGISPVWAAEVEPYPIAVTRSRFPNMKHLGDISKIHGSEIEPVDIITFGSPCQDLSTAGLRKGLKHTENGDEETTRSGLFMEAIRIIKEMRCATNGVYPRIILWENVPGAFTSNQGEDFRIVLEEIIKIVEPSAVMPSVPKAGWAYADCWCGDGWSIAYRVFDAQYWGVPQRRRRIYLVADFASERAGEISFEREGLRGYFAKSGTPWQTTAAVAEKSVGTTDRAGEDRRAIPYTLKIRSGCAIDSYGKAAGKGALIQENKATTLSVTQDQYLFQPCDCVPKAYSFDSLSSNSMKSPNPYSGCRQTEIARTIDTTDNNPSKNQGGIAVVQPVHDVNGAAALQGTACNNVARIRYLVRRLTPTECARLQGFSDCWGKIDAKTDFTDAEYQFWLEVRNTHASINDKKVKEYTKEQMLTWYNKLHTDSSEYKMWGNGIALPTALYMMQGVVDAIKKGSKNYARHYENG